MPPPRSPRVAALSETTLIGDHNLNKGVSTQISRRRSAAARRAACMRLRRVEVVSDASDVGADSDSDDQWTELDDGCE